jgi:hypothetical protein
MLIVIPFTTIVWLRAYKGVLVLFCNLSSPLRFLFSGIPIELNGRRFYGGPFERLVMAVVNGSLFSAV